MFSSKRKYRIIAPSTTLPIMAVLASLAFTGCQSSGQDQPPPGNAIGDASTQGNPVQEMAATTPILLTPTSGGSFKDSSGNTWTLDSAGNVKENGTNVPDGGGTSGLTYVDGKIWGQDSSTGNWYSWNGTTWVGPSTTSPIPTQVVSASGTTIPTATQIIDSQKNKWTVSGGVVNENGAAAGYSANVTLLLYYIGTVYQENNTGGWWSWSGATWNQVAGDPRPATPSPTPTPTPTSGVSTSGTTVPPASQITDSQKNKWTVTGGVVNENGAAAGYSANVTLLLYYNGTVYQENNTGGWWSWSGATWNQVAGDPRPATPSPTPTPTTTPTPTPTPTPTSGVSASGTTVPPASQITDSQKNKWTVSGGVVTENGAAAGYSANVTLLLYYNGTVYQENNTGGWWSWSGATWNQVSGDPRPSTGGTTTPPSTSGNFTVSVNGGFKNPSGASWNMRGLDAGVQDALTGFGNLLKDYPGLTAIRLNCNPNGDSASSIDQVVQEYTAKGIVVEVEDHADTDNGDNVAWYQQMANAYKGNPYVFLETPNEPSDPNTSQYQIQIINAIRAAGFKNPIGVQPEGGYDFSVVSSTIGSVGTNQLFVTPHIYECGSTTNPQDAVNYVNGDISNSKNMGLWPVIDEFGDACDGYTRNPDGPAVITAVESANENGQAGGLFWAMDNGNHSDGADSAYLTPDGSQLTSDGVQLQSWLK